MTTSPHSSSKPGQPVSSNFDRLHTGVQRWIWQQQWPALRSIQEQSIPPILAGETDLIISAGTASGKTEAAFLPICSRLMEHSGTGIRTLCVSPLKALINDQYRRLSGICDTLELAVTPWHGDIDTGRKRRLLKQPSGILIITPESLEALFVRHGAALANLFQGLDYIVVDELHAFIGSERGKQLQSLMHRVEQVKRGHIPRIGLSATLGDMGLAAEFLRPGKAAQVKLIQSVEDGQEIRIQVRGYRQTEPNQEDPMGSDSEDRQDAEEDTQDAIDIATHLFQVLRGETNLIFINSRSDVEAYADRLRRLCAQHRVPNEFWPHHGSLSKEIRAEAEQALKSDMPSNVICTTTLEMGIDVGSVKSIAQVGAPFSVSSTRQRLGRSGRKSGPAIARFYISEREVTPQTPPLDALHPALVQTIAIINLMIFAKWCEPPVIRKLHFSTLIQQILSMIAQYGGVTASQLWQVLCETGAFQQMHEDLLIKLLRQLGKKELIQQTHDGVLILGLKGERLVNHYSFYTAFQTPEEYRMVTRGQTLGTLPTDFPLIEGMFIIFAGCRWQVCSVDIDRKVVDVAQATAGQVPKFSGNGGSIHDTIRQEMYRIYCGEDMPLFLDRTASDLLKEARENFGRFGLDRSYLFGNDDQTLLFCWMGSQVVNTICLLLNSRGVKVGVDGIAIAARTISPDALTEHLQELVAMGPVDALELAAVIKDKRSEKHDLYLSEELLCWNYASANLEVQQAWETLKSIIQ